MAYTSLPPVKVRGVADTTGQNTGNYTATLDTTELVTALTEFECYHLRADGPVGFGLQVDINNKDWSITSQGWQNEWDPQQPMLLRSGDVLYFYFLAPFGSTPVPTITAWFRYDPQAAARQGVY